MYRVSDQYSDTRNIRTPVQASRYSYQGNLPAVNYHPQKFLGLLAPTQYASVTRLSPAFRVRVGLRETRTVAVC